MQISRVYTTQHNTTRLNKTPGQEGVGKVNTKMQENIIFIIVGWVTHITKVSKKNQLNDYQN